jgi:hypothetical protein
MALTAKYKCRLRPLSYCTVHFGEVVSFSGSTSASEHYLALGDLDLEKGKAHTSSGLPE